jgi:hypothetical protein
VVNDQVLISTEKKDLWAFKTGREKQVLSRHKLKSVAITPTIQDGVLYLPTQRRLFAIALASTSTQDAK